MSCAQNNSCMALTPACNLSRPLGTPTRLFDTTVLGYARRSEPYDDHDSRRDTDLDLSSREHPRQLTIVQQPPSLALCGARKDVRDVIVSAGGLRVVDRAWPSCTRLRAVYHIRGGHVTHFQLIAKTTKRQENDLSFILRLKRAFKSSLKASLGGVPRTLQH